MPESPQRIFNNWKNARRSATALFLVVAVALLFADVSPDTFFVFGLVPAVLLAFVRRAHMAAVIQSVVLGLWTARRLHGTAPEELPFDYYFAILGVVVGFKLADFAANGWKRTPRRIDAKMPSRTKTTPGNEGRPDQADRQTRD